MDSYLFSLHGCLFMANVRVFQFPRLLLERCDWVMSGKELTIVKVRGIVALTIDRNPETQELEVTPPSGIKTSLQRFIANATGYSITSRAGAA